MRVAPSLSLGAAAPVLMATEQTAPGDCIHLSVRPSVHPSIRPFVHQEGAAGVDEPQGAPSTAEDLVFCPKKAALSEHDLPQLG